MLRITDGNLDHLGPILTGDELTIGLIVDSRYRVERRIARGGMGEILFATDLKLQRPVAIKVLAPDLSTEEWRRRFGAEARTMAQIEHPGIVPLHDFGTFPDGRLYYTMKFVEGRTLTELIDGKEDRRRLVEILARVCDILHFAHERRILHRDLKPSNIMVDSHEQIYLMDWGIARVLENLLRSRSDTTVLRQGLTATGTVLGTLEYMSPEQARGDLESLDRRSDVYSLGAILYESSTGVPPHVGTTVQEILESAKAAAPIPPRQHNAKIPKDLESICLTAMARDREDRYPTAAAMADDLRRFLRADPLAARPRPTFGRLWRKVIRNRALAFSLALASSLAVAMGVWIVVRSTKVSKRIHTNLEQAQSHEQGGRLAQAREAYRAILELDEDIAAAREGYRRVEAALALEREALALLESGRAILERAQHSLRNAKTDTGEVWRLAEEAHSFVEEALRKAPHLAQAHYLLGVAWEIQGWDDRAAECWETAVARDPTLGAAHYRLGRIRLVRALLTQRPEPAAEPLHACLESNRGFDNPVERYTASAMLLYLAEEREALVRIAHNGTELFATKEGTEDLYWIGGFALEGDARLRAFDTALSVHPHHAWALFSRAQERARRKDWDLAIADYTAALRIKPRSAEAHLYRGRVWTIQGNLRRALADFEQSLAVAPPDWPWSGVAKGHVESTRRRIQHEGTAE